MFPFKRHSTVKCDYCEFIASSTHELLTKHSCYRTIRSRNAAQQTSHIYKPSVINNPRTQALRSLQLPPTRQINVRDNILKNVRNELIENLSQVHYGSRPLITSSQSIPSSSWVLDETLDESKIPIPVLECISRNELLSGRNSSSRDDENFIPKPVTAYRKSPPKSLERASSPIPLYQLLNTSERFAKISNIKRKPSNMTITPASKLVSETSSEPANVMLVSPINKEITIVSLDDAINELKKRMNELPYEIRLQLEHEFLQNIQDAVDNEEKRITNTV